MKKGKEKNSKKNAENKIDEQNNNLYNTKQTVTFDGFLVYEKVTEEEENFLKMNEDQSIEPRLKEWLMMQHNSNKTKSRFTNLFKEMEENDKKEGKNTDNENKNEEKLISNNLIEEEKDKNIDNNNNIENMNESMKNLKIDDNMNNNDNINNKNDNIINLKNNNNNSDLNNIDNSNNINIINNDFFNDKININNNNQNINVINNNFPNINTINNDNNNNIMNQNYISNNATYPKNIQDYNYSNRNSGYFSSASTAPSSFDIRNNSLFSNSSSSSGTYFIPKNDNNNNSNDKNSISMIVNNNINNNDNFNFSNRNSNKEKKSRPSEKKFDLNIDIKRILYLEDRRTTLMIKNIPNKFQRDALLKTIDENFKGAYDLFILPTDASGFKNFGYSFINFTNCYYIPYFYFLFHEKKWSSTNSQKVCQITYSKIQGRNSLLSHYSSKIVFKNSEVKKYDVNTKFIIPNEYYNLFSNAFPNFSVDKFETYFVTKMPFRY